MKKFISVLVLVCIMASFCTVSAFAATDVTVNNEADLRAALLNSDVATITLTANITVNAVSGNNFALEIKRPVAINGGGMTIDSSAGRVINIETTGEVSISNLNIVGEDERGINIINQPATVNLTDVNISADNYAIMLATSSGDSTLNITRGVYSGANTINIAGPNSKVTIDNADITSNDSNPSDKEGYAAIALYNTADGSNVNVTNSTLRNNSGSSESICISNSTRNATVNYGSSTLVGGVYAEAVAFIEYSNGTAYACFSLADAIELAEDGETIELVRNVDLAGEIIDVSESITINANGKTITNGALKVGEGKQVELNDLGNAADKDQLLSGKLPVKNVYGVPSTADNSDMPLWTALFLVFAAVALLTTKKKKA